MNRDEFEDKGLLDKLDNLKIEKFTEGSQYIAVAPTWLVSNKLTLEDFLEDFESPLKKDKALRDFACMPTSGVRPFFQNSEVLIKNSIPNRHCPIDINLNIDPSFRPKPGMRYFIANDLSVSRDSTGVAMVHKEYDPRGKLVYVLDFSIEIKASTLDTVNYASIRLMIMLLKRRGFHIIKVGYDQFQSHDSAVIMAGEGFETEIVAYHDSFVGCGFLWELIHQEELIYGDCDATFIGEASELQVINKKRIDHLTSGGVYNSKDVWDAVVNACVLASKDNFIKSTEPEYI